MSKHPRKKNPAMKLNSRASYSLSHCFCRWWIIHLFIYIYFLSWIFSTCPCLDSFLLCFAPRFIIFAAWYTSSDISHIKSCIIFFTLKIKETRKSKQFVLMEIFFWCTTQKKKQKKSKWFSGSYSLFFLYHTLLRINDQQNSFRTKTYVDYVRLLSYINIVLFIFFISTIASRFLIFVF